MRLFVAYSGKLRFDASDHSPDRFVEQSEALAHLLNARNPSRTFDFIPKCLIHLSRPFRIVRLQELLYQHIAFPRILVFSLNHEHELLRISSQNNASYRHVLRGVDSSVVR